MKIPYIKNVLIAVFLILVLAACGTTETPATPGSISATDLPPTLAPQLPTPILTPPATRLIEVSDVQVQIGVGSPIPVDVVAGAIWPDQCAQLNQINQTLNGRKFEIEILATPAESNCSPDFVGQPFRITLPLNIIEPGTYTVEVNGVQASFDWPAASPEPQPVENLGLTIAFIGSEGNLWLADAAGGPPRQLTSDAARLETGGNEISYYFPKISSDGRYVAVRRDAGEPISSGVQYQFGLWVYDTWTGDSRPVYENPVSPPAGFDWKPGTHLLAYGIGADPNYFAMRGGKPDATLATGIYAVDLDSGVPGLLVSPGNGYTLIQPVWSPDGRLLSFDEVIYMEGKGPFAYYDFEAKQYISWNEPLGNYDWSPDSSQLAYDRLSYTATGIEHIFTRPIQQGEEVQVSIDLGQGYAFYPIYSPDGEEIAYLVNPGGPESFINKVIVQDLLTGDILELGSFESVWYLEWSSDGRALIFSTGPYESQVVYVYDVMNGVAIELAQGNQPSLAQP